MEAAGEHVDRRRRLLGIEGEVAPKRERGREGPGHHMGVGDRSVRAASTVGGGTGTGTGALGADAQAIGTVDPGDASPAGTDGDDVDRRAQDLEPFDDPGGPERSHAVAHEADVERSAAHVERDQSL